MSTWNIPKERERLAPSFAVAAVITISIGAAIGIPAARWTAEKIEEIGQHQRDKSIAFETAPNRNP